MISSRKKVEYPRCCFLLFFLKLPKKKKRPKKAGTLIVGLVGHFFQKKKKLLDGLLEVVFPTKKNRKKNTPHSHGSFFPEAENRPSEARAISMGELVEEFLMFNRLREGFFVGGFGSWFWLNDRFDIRDDDQEWWMRGVQGGWIRIDWWSILCGCIGA